MTINPAEKNQTPASITGKLIVNNINKLDHTFFEIK
jgi:hypothetical protein